MIELLKFLLTIPIAIVTFWLLFEMLMFMLELLYGGAEERRKD